MVLATTLLAIMALTICAAIVRYWTSKPLCPVCIGVSGTWLVLLVLRGYGFFVDPIILSILMGGSVVGVMSLLEKKIQYNATCLIAWKTGMVLTGFLAVYAVVSQWSTAQLLLAIAPFVAITTHALARGYMKRERATGVLPQSNQLEERLKNCC